MVYERFTDDARKVMQLAHQEAQRFNHEYISSEHILLGLVRLLPPNFQSTLKSVECDPRKLRLEIEKKLNHGPDMVTMGKLPLRQHVKNIIQAAIEEADTLGHKDVGVEHLIIGIFLCGDLLSLSSLKHSSIDTRTFINALLHSIPIAKSEHSAYMLRLCARLEEPTRAASFIFGIAPEAQHLNALLSEAEKTGATILELRYFSMPILPSALGNLSALETLILDYSHFETLPAEISRLTSLKSLSLDFARIRELPSELASLNSLVSISVQGTTLDSPPQEIANQGIKAVKIFLNGLLKSSAQRFEAKLLILGQGGVGKSHLSSNLRDVQFENTESTLGVDVSSLQLEHPDRPDTAMQLNIWDFAGQEIEHATHQFFLSSDAICLLAWNARHGHLQGRLHYWLELIRSRTPEIPVILVATHVDLRAPDLNTQALCRLYPQVRASLHVDNTSRAGVPELLSLIQTLAASLPRMGQRWPESWLKVEHEIKQIREPQSAARFFLKLLPSRPSIGRHQISYQEFLAVCERYGVSDSQSAERLCETLHLLGIVLRFGDDETLQDLVVLQPNWITKAISFCVTDSMTKDNRGLLRHDDLPRIWSNYDRSLYPAFVALMTKFELCYRIESHQGLSGEHSLLPSLLPYEETASQFVASKAEMIYRLSSVPPGIMGRFIVRTHRFTLNAQWRDGVVLGFDGQFGRAELNEDRRELRIRVDGSSPTNLFAILTDTMDQILSSYPGLDAEKWVPCNCQGDGASRQRCTYEFKYRDLVKRIKAERTKIECNETLADVSLKALLYGIHESSTSEVREQVKTVELFPEENYRQVILLGQRGVIQNLNRLDAPDTRFPNVFAISKGMASVFRLRLICQSPRGWHYASEDAIYQLNADGETLSVIAPILCEIVPLLAHLVPLTGINVDLRTPIDVSAINQFQEDLAHMRSLVNYFAPEFGPTEGIRAALRGLWKLLGTVDEHRTYGGLREIETPDGFRLWLCPYHFGQFRDMPLQLHSGRFDVFLCHNSKDKEEVKKIANALRKRNLVSWLDEEQISGGESWQKAMARGLQNSSCVSVCIGENSWGAWQMEELEVSLQKSASGQFKVIPVLLPPLKKLPAECPAFLASRHAIVIDSLQGRKCFDLLAASIRS